MSTTRARATDRSKGQEKKQARARAKWRRIHHLQDFHHSHASELYTVFGATRPRIHTDLGPSRKQNVRAVQRMEIRMRCYLLPRMLSRQRSTGHKNRAHPFARGEPQTERITVRMPKVYNRRTSFHVRPCPSLMCSHED